VKGANTGEGGCVSTGLSATGALTASPSDVTNQVAATAIITTKPPTCTATGTSSGVTVTPTGTDTLSKLVSAASTNAQGATTNLVQCLTNLQNQLDPATGVNIAAQVDFVFVGINTPVKDSTTNNYNVDVYASFVAKVGTPAITSDHRRVYCPCIKGYVGDLTKVQPTSPCDDTAWTVGTQKRGISQTTQSGTSAYHATVPGSGVQSQYGASASPVVVAHVALFLVMILLAVFM